ncbi:hypothetical protein F3Y22_tig00111213pilonHSYRG00590 [Hibiscus syriacus]|uniref:RNase H type-1 domain-containing protein n=1 Tax=Hibiscus syriacus TaxID=106335 RepID=A0A6A2YUU1_HIBSY|nr:hypothetical protein F3Y22_tig00111213pilonHSYRG00590 [Hibiscus syriacus]
MVCDNWTLGPSLSETIHSFTLAADTWNATVFGYNGTKKRIVMARLRAWRGEDWCNDDSILREEAVRFYCSIFSTEEPLTGSFPCPNHFTFINESDLDLLDTIPTNFETHDALLEMTPLKGPGHDALHVEFFKKQWHHVGPSICSTIKDVFMGRNLDRDLNRTTLVLITKKDALETFSDFRPISLSNTSQAVIIDRIQSVFGKSSERKISKRKSKVFFSPTTPEATRSFVGVSLGFQVVDNLGNYLGVRTGLLPKRICHQIDVIVRQFIWGATPANQIVPLVDWDSICQQLDWGDLGFHRAHDQNSALLMKAGYALVINRGGRIVGCPQRQIESNFRGRPPNYEMPSVGLDPTITRRCLSNDLSCLNCNLHEETILHALRDCPSAKEVWDRTLPQSPPTDFFSHDLIHWLHSYISNNLIHHSLNIPWCLVCSSMVWHVWKSRNDLVFNDQRPHLESTISCGFIWSQHFHGFGSVGGAFRDSEGNWLYGFHESIGITDVLQAELWGLLVGLDIACSLGFELLHVQTDTATIVKLITNASAHQNPFPIVHAIHQIRQRCRATDITWIPRKCNKLVDVVAKMPHPDSLQTSILVSTPLHLHDLLARDIFSPLYRRLEIL